MLSNVCFKEEADEGILKSQLPGLGFRIYNQGCYSSQL